MGFLLHHLIDTAAGRRPEAEAFRYEGSGLTYGELARRSSQLANLLVDLGVESMDRVGIYMTKGPEVPVAIYGILKAGAAYVPIDPSAPAARIRFIIEDCRIRHLVTGATRQRQARELARAIDGLDFVIGASGSGSEEDGATFHPWSDLAAADDRSPDVRVTEGDLAYIMYTSGSTGVPKGLMHTHHSGMSYARLSARTYEVGPDDRLGNHAPLHFDISTFDFLTGPLCGATTVIIPEEATMFPVSLAELIEAERLTFWYSVPLALIQLLTRGGIETRDCRSLRWVLFGGEPFPPKYLWQLMDLWPQARFSNSYGPAEVNQCTHYHVPGRGERSDSPIPIGKVWEGAEGRIVGPDDREVGKGDTGELLIRAPTMMRGYWGRPDLNRAAFLTEEMLPGFAKTFYRTGDLVHEREDGLLMFVGRRDRQIKIRGYRVELDEIENVFASFAEVGEAAALGVRSADGSVEVVVVVQPGGGAEVDPSSLRARSAERLPGYAVPSRVIVRPVFPRTASGKIDRRALAGSLEQEGARD